MFSVLVCSKNLFISKSFHQTQQQKKRYNIRIMSVFKTPATASRWPECPFVFFMLLYTYIKYSWISLHPQSTYINIYNFIWNIHFFLPPKFPQGLAQFCVVQVWILIRELSAGRLRPDHERIHGSLDVRFTLQGSVPSHGHWYQGPVVPL